MTEIEQEERSHRVAGGLFGLGTVCMAIAGAVQENPYFLISAACQLVAWACFIHHANKLEASRR